jgi:hypothetical protein
VGNGLTSNGTTMVPSAAAYKFFAWTWDNGMNGRGGVEFTNTSQYTVNWVVKPPASSSNTGFAEQNGNFVSTEWTDGQWYEYIVHYQVTSPTTTRTQFWYQKDGAAPILRVDFTGSMSSGNAPGVGDLIFGLNYNQQRLAGQNLAVWWGELEAIDGSKYAKPFGF